MAKIFTINIQKGGVGKTTTAHELAAHLHEKGYKVLAIDLDQQMNLSRISGAELTGYYTIYEVLRGDCPIEDSIQEEKYYDICPAHKKFADADKEFSALEDVYRLTDALKDIKDKYDFIVIDTPPNLGILPSMALTAADYVIIPCEASSSGIQGLGQLYEKIEIISNPERGTNKKLKVLGMLLARYKYRTIFAQNVNKQMKKLADNKKTQIFKTYIRESIAVQESQAWKQSLLEYDAKCKPAQDYKSFTEELLKEVM